MTELERKIKTDELEATLRSKGMVIERTGRFSLTMTPRPSCVKPRDKLELSKEHAR
jgi:hypothetical protein